MNQLQVFNFEANEVRTVLVDNEPYFVGKDVADILGYSNSRDAIARHVFDEDKAGVVIHDGSQNRNVVAINESGMYALIFGSTLKEAERFKRWVTREVLPAIRKTGSYSVPTNPMDALKLMFEATEQTQKEVAEVSSRVLTLEEDTPLSSSEYGYISRKLNQKVMEFASLKNLEDDQDAKKLLFKDINSGIHAVAGVMTRSQLRNRHFNDVVNYIRDWIPSQSTLILIERLVS